MQAYKWEDLDATAQIYAFNRYAYDIPPFNHHRDNTVQEVNRELKTWLFTEHGERIA